MPEQNNITQALISDNGILWAIIACALVAIFIIAERFLNYHRCQINTRDFLEGIYNNLEKGKTLESVSICEDTPGPIAELTRSAIFKASKGQQAVRNAIEETSLSEIPRLEKNLNILATVAHVAPLLGLLGTIVGMIGAFYKIGGPQGAFINLADLAPNIGTALITTAAGLTVAIPCHAFYNLLATKVQHIVNEMEIAASEIITFLDEHPIDDSELTTRDARKDNFVNDEEIVTSAEQA